MYTRTEIDNKRGSFFGGIARFVLLILIGCGAGAVGVAAQSYVFFTHNLPNIEKLKNYDPPIVTKVFADKGELIAEFASQRRFVLPIDQIPRLLQAAFVSAEDKNFWQHGGVDKEGIVRAVKMNLLKPKEGWGPGGSTITQQVAKIFLLSADKKLIRKIKEAILSVRIERSLSKEQILYLYLNEIYLGSSAYGVEAAAQTYFDKSVKDLSIAECALLAGLAKFPSAASPKKNLNKALERRGYVLRRMFDEGYITEAQFEAANKENPKISTQTNPYAKVAPDYVEHVRRYVERKYGTDALYKEGLQIWTAVDIDMTKAAQAAMDRGLRELDKREGYRGPLKTNVREAPALDEPLRFGDVTEAVVTHIDNENIYVRMGSYVQDGKKREYLGQIKTDPNPKWWVRQPFVRPELRTRNFAPGDLAFQVGDLILVRLLDPNPKRRDLYLQKYGKADPGMKNYKEYTENMLTYFPVEPEQEPVVQSALMLRENRSGHVKVMLGGYNFSESKYNRAIQARRQAGSSFKPVIYAAALNKGFTCADMILDSPLQLAVPGTGEVWKPKNYRGGYQGPVTFRDALVKSRNIPTIKILQQIGIEQAKAYARKLGYTSPLTENLTMALGSMGVSLAEQLTAYSVFPNRGYLVPSIYVTKIVDRKGKILEHHDLPILLDDPVKGDLPQIQQVAHQISSVGVNPDPDLPDKGAPMARRTIDEATAYIMTSMLQGVFRTAPPPCSRSLSVVRTLPAKPAPPMRTLTHGSWAFLRTSPVEFGWALTMSTPLGIRRQAVIPQRPFGAIS